MTDLVTILPIILYIFGIILMIVLIILGLKLLQMFDKMDRILDNIEDKVNSLNGIFYVINKTTSSIDLISTKVVNSITNIVSRLFKRKNKEDDTNE